VTGLRLAGAILPTYVPERDELAVVRLTPGEQAVVSTTEGDVVVFGEPPAELAGLVVAYVPGDRHACGWLARSMTTNVAKLAKGRHALDRPVWSAAEQLFKHYPVLYVRVARLEHHTRQRHMPVGVRIAPEVLPG
jgi:hypothetical protein